MITINLLSAIFWISGFGALFAVAYIDKILCQIMNISFIDMYKYNYDKADLVRASNEAKTSCKYRWKLMVARYVLNGSIMLFIFSTVTILYVSYS